MENKVREFRLEKGLTQFELSKISNITQADLSQIERGKIHPYPGWRRRLSKALSVKEKYLFPEIYREE